MSKLKRTADLDMAEIDTFINEQGTDAYELLDDHIMVENEDGQLEIIETKMSDDGIVYVVTDMLETGWMVDHMFMPDGTVTESKKYI